MSTNYYLDAADNEAGHLGTSSSSPGAPPDPLPSAASTVWPFGLAGVQALLAAGELRPGDRLHWNQRHLRAHHTAVVQPDGTLVVQGRPCTSPSAAARYATGGTSVNGWNVWRCERDGRLLADKRARLRSCRAC